MDRKKQRDRRLQREGPHAKEWPFAQAGEGHLGGGHPPCQRLKRTEVEEDRALTLRRDTEAEREDIFNFEKHSHIPLCGSRGSF